MTYWEAFQTLPLPTEVDGIVFQGARFPQRNSDYIAKSQRGTPAFLLRVSSTELQRLPVFLKHIRVAFDVSCRVKVEGESIPQDNFCIVECLSPEPTIQMCFVLAAAAMISPIPENPSRKQVLDCIQSIVEAFRRVEMPSPLTVRGLWGELFVIDRSRNPATLIDGWHDDRFDKFDFAIGVERLEVKTANSESKTHEFSLSQLRPNAQVSVCVASIELQRSVSGLDVLELARQIHAKIANMPPLIAHLWEQVLSTLSSDEEGIARLKFDTAHAEGTFILVDASSIPCPTVPGGVPITNVRFSIALGPIRHRLQEHSATCESWRLRMRGS